MFKVSSWWGERMSIILQKRIVSGWKAEGNSRFGDVVVVDFIDEKSGKVLFEYAPFLYEKEFWGYLFNDVFEVDRLHKELINKYAEIDPLWSKEFFKNKKENKINLEVKEC